MTNKFDNYPVSVLKSVITDFYSEDEVISAKQLLTQSIDSSHHSTLNTHLRKRIGDNKLERSVDDIIHIFQYADDNGMRDDIPVFCAVSLARVPVIPDEMTDLASIRQDVNSVTEQLQILMNNVSSAVQDISQTNKVCSDIQQSLHKFGIKSGIADDRRLCSEAHKNMVHDPGDDRLNIAQTSTAEVTLNDSAEFWLKGQGVTHEPPQDGARLVQNDVQRYEVHHPPLPLPSSSRASRSSNQVTSRSPLSAANIGNDGAARSNVDDDEFVEVKRKKRAKTCRGKADGTSFKGVMSKAVFCVKRLEPGTSTEIVCDHLSSQGVNVLSCFTLERKDAAGDTENTGDRPQLVSMRVTVASDNASKMMSPDLWPRGVSVRRWAFKPRQGPPPVLQ